MHIEFLVEETSAEAALNSLLPRVLGEGITFRIHAHQGKPDLLAKLPGRLRGYRHWIPTDWRLVVLVDEDREDCNALKARLETIAVDAGFVTKAAAGNSPDFEALNRVAIEELEAWFFGDVTALCAAYPRLDPNLGRRARYRAPDAIRSGTWEALERELQRKGYFRGGLAKTEAARAISAHMDPWRNRSHSFQVFWQGLNALRQQTELTAK